ncbi:hypothetical protein FOA52_001649 [Chlamydomonas sp. UWO 241]|nr:hypothetical protein FOA52_001649 [Chlamydomonas sp. UWO 241]
MEASKSKSKSRSVVLPAPGTTCAVRDPDVVRVLAASESPHPSCLTPDEVDEIARDAGIPTAPHRTAPHRTSATTPELLVKLHELYKTTPGQEVKWLERIRERGTSSSRALADRLEKTAFRPEHPEEWLESPREWLSDVDIEIVLRQYETNIGERKKFRFVGVFPSDFAKRIGPAGSGAAGSGAGAAVCVSQRMCDTTVQKLVRDGIHHIGVVFNSDPHTAQGRHWTSCYLGIDPSSNRYGAFYYDSVANGPMPGMMDFMKRIKAEADGAGLSKKKEFVIRSNTVRKQFEDTECGVYSIIFILMCLQTELTFDEICSHAIHDDATTNKLRHSLFRAPSLSTAAAP